MGRRLISSTWSEMKTYDAKTLKRSIEASEGRVVLSQCYVGHPPLTEGTTNPELAVVMGADMVFMNGYSMDPESEQPGLKVSLFEGDAYVQKQLRLRGIRELAKCPMGIYLECGAADDDATSTSLVGGMVRADRVASEENLRKVREEGADFVVLGGNPGTGVTLDRVVEATATAKHVLGDDVLIWAGKWEDGVNEKVLGDPTASYDSKDVIKRLIDAGADVICLPMPGSRTAITVECIRDLVTFIHTYKPGTLAMSFLDGSIEGADVDTVRQCMLMSKQTGADIHAIGDAGLCGMSVPEDIYQMAITAKGRRLTWLKTAAGKR